jgi:hypothetical protein
MTDSEASVEEEIVLEEDNMSTPEFIAEAAAAGFSMKELKQAEQELSPSQVCSEPNNSRSLAEKIVSVLVQRKLESRPWKGPLPPPRVSPPRTLGDAIASAKRINGTNSRQRNEVQGRSMRYGAHCSAPNFGVSMNRGQWHSPIPFCLSPANSGEDDRRAELTQGVDEGGILKVIGCSSLRRGGGELGTLKTLTYGYN